MTQNPQYATLIKLHKIINLISAKFAENITVAKKGDKKSYTKSMILFSSYSMLLFQELEISKDYLQILSMEGETIQWVLKNN